MYIPMPAAHSSIGLVHLNRMSVGPATKGRQNTSTAPGGQTSCYATDSHRYL